MSRHETTVKDTINEALDLVRSSGTVVAFGVPDDNVPWVADGRINGSGSWLVDWYMAFLYGVMK